MTALSGVSFDVGEGQMLAVIGPNGAGKTSILNCINGFYRPQKGEMIFENQTIYHLPPHQIARLGIGRTFQNIELFTGLSVLDNLMAARHLHLKRGALAGAIYFGPARREEIRHREMVEDIIDLLEMEPYRKRVVGLLPYGVRKRVELGRALALEPKLLLLDEPLAGMNLEEKEDMARFIIDIHELKNKEYEKNHLGLFEEYIENGKGEEIALICYTSGTTGLPKGAMVSHKALVAIANAWRDVDHWSDSDRYVSFIPPGWIAEQAVGVAGQLVSGMEVNFPEEPETVQENIREIGPSILFFAPRLWENINRMIQAKITDTSALRRWLYHVFLPIGYKTAEYRSTKKRLGPFLGFLHQFAHWILFRPLKDRVGLSQIRCAYTAGSAVSPEILNYFQAIGVNIKQLYGGSEQGLVTIHLDGRRTHDKKTDPKQGERAWG